MTGIVVGPEPAVDDVVIGPAPGETVVVQDVGLVGPQGPAGPETASMLLTTVTATSDTSGERVVTVDPSGAYVYADAGTLEDANSPLWLTTNGAAAGSDLVLLTLGEHEFAGWAWFPGPVWLGDQGRLTQMPPTRAGGSVFQMQVADVVSPTRIVFRPRTPIVII